LPDRDAIQTQRGELLVAILKEPSDLTILMEHCWYRIPVDKVPRRWPPRWLAFYHTKAFGQEPAYLVTVLSFIPEASR